MIWLDILQQSLFFLLLPIMAFLYASVGHGGASGYLALMSFFAFSEAFMKPTALVLNVLVSGVSFYFFYKEGFFKKALFYPFAISSIPFAFLGGLLTISGFYYKIILAIALFFAVLRLLGVFGEETTEIKPLQLPLALLIGAVIGFLSGLIGIGGGIILSPVLLLLAWANNKETAAVSALFIFVNSIAALFGFCFKGGVLPTNLIIFVGLALVGGLLGAYVGSKKSNSGILRKILALVLLIAIFKLIKTA